MNRKDKRRPRSWLNKRDQKKKDSINKEWKNYKEEDKSGKKTRKNWQRKQRRIECKLKEKNI